MSDLVQKLGTYQILTNLLPGVLFVWLLRLLFQIEIPVTNFVEGIVAYYFAGLIINRIGSLIIVPILTTPIGKSKSRLINYAPYVEYISAAKYDTKIDALSEVNNCFRSFLTTALLLPVTYGLFRLYAIWPWLQEYWAWAIVAFLIILFYFSHKKQTKYIRERVNKVNNDNS